MKKFKLFLVITIVILSGHSAVGCGCMGNSSDEEEIKQHNNVVKGKVIRIETVEISTDDDIFKITTVIKKFHIQVLCQYKGKTSKNIVEIYSGNGNGDCGFPFQLQKSYLIFFDKVNSIFNTKPPGQNEKFYYTDICYNTREWSECDHDKIVRLIKEKP